MNEAASATGERHTARQKSDLLFVQNRLTGPGNDREGSQLGRRYKRTATHRNEQWLLLQFAEDCSSLLGPRIFPELTLSKQKHSVLLRSAIRSPAKKSLRGGVSWKVTSDSGEVEG